MIATRRREDEKNRLGKQDIRRTKRPKSQAFAENSENMAFCISFSVIVAAIGNMVPSNWKGDFGILAIIFAALFIAYFAYYIFLEKT